MLARRTSFVQIEAKSKFSAQPVFEALFIRETLTPS